MRQSIAVRFLGFLASAALLLPALADEGGPTKEQVGDLQAKFRGEREAAVKDGVPGKFAADILAKADEFAKKGDDALAAGRLAAAAEAFRDARWHLPSLPADFPEHVSRVYGSARFRHGDWVEDLSYTADGSRLATASRDGTVKIWDVATGRELRAIRDLADRAKSVAEAGRFSARSVAVAFRPDGKELAFTANKDVKIYDADTGKELRALTGHTGGVTALAYSADGKWLASGSLDATVRVWDEEGKESAKLLGHNQKVVAVCFSPDGKLVASLGGEGAVRVTNHETKSLIVQRIYYPTGSGLSLAYAADGKHFAHCGINGLPRLCNAPAAEGKLLPTTGDPVQTLAEKPNNASCIALSHDGKLLAIGGQDRGVRVYDTASDQPIRAFHGHLAPVTGVAFHPNGRQLASVSQDQTVRLWHLEPEGVPRVLNGHENFVWSAAFSPDGSRAVSGGADKTLKIWDVATQKPVRSINAQKTPITTVLWAPDGKAVLSTGGDEVLKLWNPDTGDELLTLTGHKSAVMAAAYDKPGKRIVSGAADRTVKVWDAATGKETHALARHEAAVSAVAFHPDGKLIASGDAEGIIKLWDPEQPKETVSYTGHGLGISGLAFSPDGGHLASSGGDGSVRLWTLAGDKEPPLLRKIDAHKGAASSVASSADGRFLASSGADQLVKLWDAHTGNELRTYRGHGNFVSSVAFSADGRSLVSASVDRSVRVWDNGGREVSSPLAGHVRPLNGVAVSADGKLLATGSDDHTVRLWDAATGGGRGVLLGHRGPVTALAFSADSKQLASASGGTAGSTIKVWDVANAKEIKSLDAVGIVPTLAFTPDGKRLIAWLRPATTQTIVRSFDTTTWAPLDLFSERDKSVACLAFSADGELTALGGSDGNARVFQAPKAVRYLDGDLPAHQKGFADVAFTPDRKHLLTSAADGEVRVWDLEKIRPMGPRDPLHTIKAHDGRVIAFAVSPDSGRFATVGPDDVVKVFETASGKEVRNWPLRGPVRNLAFSADGKHVFTANADTTAYRLDLP